MPKGGLKSEQEIRQLLYIVDYQIEQKQQKGRGQAHDLIVIARTLRWQIGEDEEDFASYFRGNFDALYGSKSGSELAQEVLSD